MQDRKTPRERSLDVLEAMLAGVEKVTNDIRDFHAEAAADPAFDWRRTQALRRHVRTLYDGLRRGLLMIANDHGLGRGIGRPRHTLWVDEHLADMSDTFDAVGAKLAAEVFKVSVRTLYRRVGEWKAKQARAREVEHQQGRRVHHAEVEERQDKKPRRRSDR